MSSNKSSKKKLPQEKNPETRPAKRRGKVWQTLALPVLAVFTGLLVGAIVIIVTRCECDRSLRNFFQRSAQRARR